MYLEYFTNGDLWYNMLLKDGVGFEVVLLPMLLWWLGTTLLLAKLTDIPAPIIAAIATNPLSAGLYILFTVMPLLPVITLTLIAIPTALCIVVRKMSEPDKETYYELHKQYCTANKTNRRG